MRLAFVDLLFSWPPHGGADVDAYHTLLGLQSSGHDVHLFGAKDVTSWERGNFESSNLPFPSTRLDFAPRDVNRRVIPTCFRNAVDRWKPDAVIMGDGFFLKPYVGEALAHYRMAARYYAYELGCPSDFRLFRDGAACPMNYLRNPDICRRCALKAMAPEIKQWKFLAWAQEYMAARAFMPGYYDLTRRFLNHCQAVIVYNRIQKNQLDGFHNNVHIIPGGVNIREFRFVPPIDRRPDERKIVLMTGRVEDPAKGFSALYEAGERLAHERSDFEIWVTHTDPSINRTWLKAVGWHKPAEMRNLYAQADVCVFPSIWEEPFGIVAVEAMACGKPICVSRVGGLQDIVVHGETGFIFERGNGAALAECLAKLLDDGPLRMRMGAAARKRTEAEYDWQRIIEKYYPAVLEAIAK